MQANMDHWDNDMANDNQQSLERCKLVEEMLQLPLTRGYATRKGNGLEKGRGGSPWLFHMRFGGS